MSVEAFLARAGWGDARREPLAGDASTRRCAEVGAEADAAHSQVEQLEKAALRSSTRKKAGPSLGSRWSPDGHGNDSTRGSQPAKV